MSVIRLNFQKLRLNMELYPWEEELLSVTHEMNSNFQIKVEISLHEK